MKDLQVGDVFELADGRIGLVVTIYPVSDYCCAWVNVNFHDPFIDDDDSCTGVVMPGHIHSKYRYLRRATAEDYAAANELMIRYG